MGQCLWFVGSVDFLWVLWEIRRQRILLRGMTIFVSRGLDFLLLLWEISGKRISFCGTVFLVYEKR